MLFYVGMYLFVMNITRHTQQNGYMTNNLTNNKITTGTLKLKNYGSFIEY